MRVIEQENWPRREHFRLYKGLAFPHVNICVQLDITEFWAQRARAGASPTVSLVYATTKAVNRVAEMRQRIRGEEIVEYEVIHPSITVLGDNDLFGLVTLSYDPCFATFASQAQEDLAKVRGNTSLSAFPVAPSGKPTRDDLISITILPWMAFTSFAITRTAAECIPLLGFGKVQQTVGERYTMPFFINFHHALADGLHVARLVQYIEEETRELAAAQASSRR